MPPDGLIFVEELVSRAEERELLAFLEALEFETITMRGRAARRTVRHYGMQYEYRRRDVAPGAPIPTERAGWHRDAPIFGDEIAGVSLLGRSPLQLRDAEGAVTTVELPPRSAYVMVGAARWDCEHTIPATRDLRYSLTFRTLGGDG
jgi:alkylated DNA repair protein (DNA oxidative demethylase)